MFRFYRNNVNFALNMAINYSGSVWTKHLFGAKLNGVSKIKNKLKKVLKMQIVKSDYDLKYILKGGLVRSSASGKFEGNDYSSSVRISSSNIYDVANEKTGFMDEVEQKVVFKIICPDNNTAGLVAAAIKEKFKKGEEIPVEGGFPNDQRIITIANPVEYFLFDTKPAKKPENK